MQGTFAMECGLDPKQELVGKCQSHPAFHPCSTTPFRVQKVHPQPMYMHQDEFPVYNAKNKQIVVAELEIKVQQLTSNC